MRGKTRVFLAVVLVVGVAVVAIAGYRLRLRRDRVPSPDSPGYEETTRQFNHGLVALQVGLLDDAKAAFAAAAVIAPGEPAAWANLGLTELRLGEFAAAAPAIDRAARLAPASSDVAVLQALLAKALGRPDVAVARFRRAVDLDPGGVRVRFALAQEIESAAGPGADAEAQQLLAQMRSLQPDNVAILLEQARLAAKRMDAPLLQRTVAGLAARAGTWPSAAVEQYRVLQGSLAGADYVDAARAVAVLRNVLRRVPAFQDDLAAITEPVGLLADPLQQFLRLPSLRSAPSDPDDGLMFAQGLLPTGTQPRVDAALAFSPNGADAPVVVTADGREIRAATAGPWALPFPGGAAGTPPSPSGILAVDWHRDFRTGLVLAGRGGVRLLAQGSDGTFRDLTKGAVSADVLNADCFGVWTADLDLDGDLDLVVGVNGAEPVALRNNADGTWGTTRPFAGVVGLRAFVWGDLDGDGDPDAAMLDAQGHLQLFENRQGAQFVPMTGPGAETRRVVALAVGDVNGDGVLDLVTLDATGTVRRASRGPRGWEEEVLAVWTEHPNSMSVGSYRLFLADMDNNGSPDLVVSGGGRSQIWLSGARGFRPLPPMPSVDVVSVVDLNDDGQLDVVGLVDGRAVNLLGHGTKGYHWQVIRPRAQMAAGDQRINSFGVGGEIEIRSGLLVQKQTLTGEPVHFGLGMRTGIDVARIVWPNGVVQAEFAHRADQVIVAEQRLKGSCPWVFTDDGTGLRFVTDFLWRSPLGLRINAVDTAGVSQTEDWVKIRADQLVPRNGAYDVRITAELWETHFIDHVALMTVDHPKDVEVFVDERFARVSPPLAVQAMTPPRPVAQAHDEAGRDVTALVARRDGVYLSTFGHGAYQGIAQDHFVELDLGGEISPDGHEWLVANGWIYPTDSSINVAIGQGGQVPPHGLSLEAGDAGGRWVVVDPDLGFPAGKNKTILIDLASVARAGLTHVRRLRLRTNMEIYWDAIGVARAVDHAAIRTTRMATEHAELRYRGFSQTAFGARDVPETPSYDRLANVAARWRDLVGYYTRFGDVRELLREVDDRDVIMNAGDELRMRFAAPPAPPAGWVRDFVLIGDGWVKDGDYNTAFSKTVLPLPAHGHPDYTAPSPELELEQDPVYRRHPQDWQTFQTRFVAPRGFLRGLR
jgi:hypothetical protein